MGKLFLDSSFDHLVQRLAEELESDGQGMFATRIVMVPNASLKHWLLLKLAGKNQVAGCKVITLQEGIKTFLAPSEFTEIFCSLYLAISKSQSPELSAYLKRSPGRIVELCQYLASAFIRYGCFFPSLFEPDLQCERAARRNSGSLDRSQASGESPYIQEGVLPNWQKQLIQTLFVSGHLRPFLTIESEKKVHCFGFDFLPEKIWESLPFSSIYLFSPCRHFWENLCSDRERKRLGRFWKEKGASLEKREELDKYLRDAPPLLANNGRAGRETLKILDRFDLEIVEEYEEIEPDSTLKRLQRRLLDFIALETNKYPEDRSIQLSKTGSSLLREVEHLRISILRLMEEERLLYSDIAVLAPDIEPYASLIEFVFSDLPYRISGISIGRKSFFYQGMQQLCDLEPACLSNGEEAVLPWDSNGLMALFENPSFKAFGEEDLKVIREWLSCPLSGDFESRLLDWFIYIFPEEKNRIATSSADVLERCIDTLQSIRRDLAQLRKPRTLAEWAASLTQFSEKYFSIDLSNEADAAAWNFFKQTMAELIRADKVGALFPFAPIKALLKRPIPGSGQIHSSHLHAIRFGSLEEGSLTPVRALFLIGMDEENFPRRSPVSSLDLLRGKKIYTFETVDQDRYLFLQSIFAAKEFLHISYGHLSNDGNPINPCSFVEELRDSLDALIIENKASLPFAQISGSSFFSWPERPAESLPQGEEAILLSDLASLARHPWEFYLQKKFGIRFEWMDNKSFMRQKRKILRSSLQGPMSLDGLPPGICGEALKIDVQAQAEQWKSRIEEWNVHLEPISFKMSCMKKKKVESGWESPPLEIRVNDLLRVKITGEMKTCSSVGFVHAGNDTIDGLLKAWPECLAALVASERTEIHFLKSGKVKSLKNPLEALKYFVIYYFHALSAPSPFLPDWADSLLRKGVIPEKESHFEDPVLDWVLGRISLPPAGPWVPILRDHFAELSALYPGRGGNASV